MTSIVIFWKVLIEIKTLKKFKPDNFKIFRNKMDEKVGFEIILKRCEHVAYVTVRMIRMITISIIANQY